ncbi:MAG: hypothetical protein K0S65_1655, partial [Labilithrix sp.]|nr:hypothetical protein [Labilithrix sp.]
AGGDPDAGNVSFTLPATPQPPSEATILQAWKDKCNGVCAPSDEDAGSDPPPEAGAPQVGN